jgi:predicted transcriptional regulator
MRVAKIQIRKDDDAVLHEAGAAFIDAWRNGRSEGDLFTFASPAQLFSVLTPRRWTLIERLQDLGPSSLRGLARDLGRDVKRVHEDVAVLLDWGLIERTAAGRLAVPFDRIHADFDIGAAA